MNNQQPPEPTNHTHTSFFKNAAGFTLNNPIFMDVGPIHYPQPRRTGESHYPAWLEADDYNEGLGRLHESLLPDAILSPVACQCATVARYIPEHLKIIESLPTHFIQLWADSLLPNMVILNGPKSNLTQLYVEKLEEFSYNTFVLEQFERDNPATLFSTITHPLSCDRLFSNYTSLLEVKLHLKPSCRRVIIVDELEEYAEPPALPIILQIIPNNAEDPPFV